VPARTDDIDVQLLPSITEDGSSEANTRSGEQPAVAAWLAGFARAIPGALRRGSGSDVRGVCRGLLSTTSRSQLPGRLDDVLPLRQRRACTRPRRAHAGRSRRGADAHCWLRGRRQRSSAPRSHLETTPIV